MWFLSYLFKRIDDSSRNHAKCKKKKIDIWGQSKNTANPVDCVAVLLSIFTLTPNILVVRFANARLMITAVQYRQLGDIECASWE